MYVKCQGGCQSLFDEGPAEPPPEQQSEPEVWYEGGALRELSRDGRVVPLEGCEADEDIPSQVTQSTTVPPLRWVLDHIWEGGTHGEAA